MGSVQRRWLAFAVAPLGAGVAFVVIGIAKHLVTHGLESKPWTSWWYLLRQLPGFGLDVSVVAAAVAWLIAPFAVAWLLGCGFRSWLAFGVTGAVLGAGVFLGLALFHIMDDPGVRLAPLGAACGSAAALLSWWIDVRSSRPQRL